MIRKSPLMFALLLISCQSQMLESATSPEKSEEVESAFSIQFLASVDDDNTTDGKMSAKRLSHLKTDTEGNIFVLDSAQEAILKIAPNQHLSVVYEASSQNDLQLTPSVFQLGPDGMIYFRDQKQCWYKVVHKSPEQAYCESSDVPRPPFLSQENKVTDNKGNTYTFNDTYVVKSPEKGASTQIGVGFLPPGKYHASETSTQDVECNSSFSPPEYCDVYGNEDGGKDFATFTKISDLAIARDGAVYVSDNGLFRRIDPDWLTVKTIMPIKDLGEIETDHLGDMIAIKGNKIMKITLPM